MDQITVSADVDQVKTVTRFVNEKLEALGCSQRIRIQLDVAVDEIFSNIARYAYGAGAGEATVQIGVEENPRRVAIVFIDHGAPCNPLAEEQPDTTHLPKMLRPLGGLGLFLVKKTMDDISYEYRDGQNRLTLRRRI